MVVRQLRQLGFTEALFEMTTQDKICLAMVVKNKGTSPMLTDNVVQLGLEILAERRPFLQCQVAHESHPLHFTTTTSSDDDNNNTQIQLEFVDKAEPGHRGLVALMQEQENIAVSSKPGSSRWRTLFVRKWLRDGMLVDANPASVFIFVIDHVFTDGKGCIDLFLNQLCHIYTHLLTKPTLPDLPIQGIPDTFETELYGNCAGQQTEFTDPWYVRCLVRVLVWIASICPALARPKIRNYDCPRAVKHATGRNLLSLVIPPDLTKRLLDTCKKHQVTANSALTALSGHALSKVCEEFGVQVGGHLNMAQPRDCRNVQPHLDCYPRPLGNYVLQCQYQIPTTTSSDINFWATVLNVEKIIRKSLKVEEFLEKILHPLNCVRQILVSMIYASETYRMDELCLRLGLLRPRDLQFCNLGNLERMAVKCDDAAGFNVDQIMFTVTARPRRSGTSLFQNTTLMQHALTFNKQMNIMIDYNAEWVSEQFANRYAQELLEGIGNSTSASLANNSLAL